MTRSLSLLARAVFLLGACSPIAQASASLASAQKAYQARDLPALRSIASSMAGEPLGPWAQGWALLAEANPEPARLAEAAKKNAGSIMERRLLERSAWERLSDGDVSGALKDLSPYAESELSAAGKCALWSAQGFWPNDPADFERALASSSGAPACVRAAALSANNFSRRDSLLAALAKSNASTRSALLEGVARSPASSAEGLAFASQAKAPGSLLSRALAAKGRLSEASAIPSSLPRLRQAAWSLAAQGAFNGKRLAEASQIDPSLLDKEGAWALFRLALLAQNASKARESLNRLGRIDPDSSRMMFWTALLIDPQGDSAQALMGRNNYHGFVLRSALGRPLFAMSPAPAQKIAASCSSYGQTAPILLAKGGASAEAGQAWAYELNKTDEGQRRCMAAAARAAGAHALALAAWARVAPSAPADLRGQWEIGERQAIERAAGQRGVSADLFGALARQESRFDPRAISAVGAIGLTQLMPRTAAELARKEKLSSPDLFNPAVNASLGARYFKEKLDRLGDARWALSAYNAGESRGRAWKEAFKGLPWVMAVELIPFEETRGYVERGYEGWAAHAELSSGKGAETLEPAAASARHYLARAAAR